MVNDMTRDQLKKKIKEKFGTYSKFCRLAEIDRYDFQKNFLTAGKVSTSDIQVYDEMVEKTVDKSESPVLTEKQRNRMKKQIERKGGVIKFCKDNDQFAESSVFQILSGSYGDTVTPTVKELMEILDVK